MGSQHPCIHVAKIVELCHDQNFQHQILDHSLQYKSIFKLGCIKIYLLNNLLANPNLYFHKKQICNIPKLVAIDHFSAASKILQFV
jgi:hypothetical protein